MRSAADKLVSPPRLANREDALATMTKSPENERVDALVQKMMSQ
jgi:hypothetical protein